MIKITSGFGNKPTFKLIPISSDCPYLEAVFNPITKMLSVVSIVKYEGFQFLFKIDDSGNKIPLPGKQQDKNQPVLYKQERLRVDHFYEYTIAERKEIEEFVEIFTENFKANDIADYFKTEEPQSINKNPESVPDGIKLKIEKNSVKSAETN